MSANLNSIDSSFINNISFTQKASTQSNAINSKDNDSALFAAQLETAQKIDIYLNEIKNCVPKTTVTIKSMNAADVQKYYQEWKNQATNYSGYKHDIIVSPKVLEKMGKDPKYAEQMLMKIKKAAIPEGFGNATIYEYKVIVRDDGEIETFACADFMNGNNKKIDYEDKDKKKDEKKKLELIYTHRRLNDQWELKTQFINSQYLLNTAVANKIIGLK